MKFLYKTMYSALLMGAMGLNATAQQQLPNSGFEEEWVDCVPWTTDSKARPNVGKTPKDWCISHVAGMNFLGNWSGKTEVGTKVDGGYNSKYATKLKNAANSVVKTQTVPGYITLGTTWSTAKGANATNKDGGSFGGISFTSRPTGLQFMYKRSRGEAKPDEQSTIVAYLWKGHITQASVPGNIGFSSTNSEPMVDRDRCVLDKDMTNCEGTSDIEKTSDFELIGYIETTITENTDEWTKFTADFTYLSDETPEYINVIISAGDYFGGASVVGLDNSLTIDDVEVFYDYSGYLNISMEPLGNIATNQDATIKIIPTADNKCTFILPNFSLESLGLNLGDIVVKNVNITEKDGEKYYEGSVDGLKLQPEGAAEDEFIIANVSLSGTTSNMKIAVGWVVDPSVPDATTPIEVTFTKDKIGDDPSTGIINVNIDNENEPIEFFNLQGFRVNTDNLTPGIYVRRQGSNVSKVLVK